MKAWVLLWLFLKGSLLSTGGFGNLPLLHDDLLSRRWATELDFAESLTIGQITPGPNGLWVLSLGYMVDGVRGALLSLLAISIPPMLVLLIYRLYQRAQEHPAIEGLVRGLGLGVIGVFLVVLSRLLGGVGIDARSVLIALMGVVLGASRRIPVILILGLGALIGLVWS